MANKHFKIIVSVPHDFEIFIVRYNNAHTYKPTRSSRKRLENYLNNRGWWYAFTVVFSAYNIYLTYRMK